MGMELSLDRRGEGPTYARVTKRLRDANGLPIGTANDNPMLDTRQYEVEYADSYTAPVSACLIAECLVAQVDNFLKRFLLKKMQRNTDGAYLAL
jgi:hypothetical protein